MNQVSLRRILLMLCCVAVVAGCATAPPGRSDNICLIFAEKADWFDDAARAERRWDISIPVLMAIMYQESSFRAKAKPPRLKVFGVIPWKRPSTAYGYAQVKNETWEEYVEAEGGLLSDRDDFRDAIDFMAWYNRASVKELGLKPTDAYSLYLAYHDGRGGFRRGTWRSKGWLIETAKKVQARANRYETQLRGCRKSLESPWWWPF